MGSEKVVTYDEFKKALEVVNAYKAQLEKHLKMSEGNLKFANVTKKTKINDTGCSARLINALYFNDKELGIEMSRYKEVTYLADISITRFSRCRNVGESTVQELKNLCIFAGIRLRK